MADYGARIYSETGELIFSSDMSILKLQGIKVIRGAGYQAISLKGSQRPFFMAIPINRNLAAGRVIELSFDRVNNYIRYHSINDQEYLLYYGSY